jgi:hypothetical protein
MTHCLTVASCAAILAAAGCARQQSAEQAQSDINRTEASDNRDVASAQKHLDLAAATEARDVSKKRCETESGDAQTACEKQADADYAAAKAQAEANQSATDASQPR